MSGKRAKKDRALARATTGEDKLMQKARLIRERDERDAEARRVAAEKRAAMTPEERDKEDRRGRETLSMLMGMAAIYAPTMDMIQSCTETRRTPFQRPAGRRRGR